MATKAELEERIRELEEEASAPYVTAVEAVNSTIVVEWQEIGGIRVGLNAVGDAVRVEFEDTLAGMYGWVGE